MLAIPESFLILWSTPLYAFIIGIEMVLSHWEHRHLYSFWGVILFMSRLLNKSAHWFVFLIDLSCIIDKQVFYEANTLRFSPFPARSTC